MAASRGAAAREGASLRDRRLEKLICWVTGGGSGLGAALAVEFSRRGALVALSGRRVERLQEVARSITAAGGRAIAVPCDVTREEDLEAAVARIVNEFGRLDVAVANAGFGVSGRLWELDADTWRRQLDVNVVGVAMTIRAALPRLRENHGRVVIVSSAMGRMALPGSSAYAASKHAVCGLADALRVELHASGVSVTTLLPGVVASEFGQVDNTGRYRPERRDGRPAQLMWPAERAARVMADAISARRREHVFTGHGRMAVLLGRHCPGLLYWMLARANVRDRT